MNPHAHAARTDALAAGPVGNDDSDGERRFVLHGVSWDQYTATRRTFEDRRSLRMAYLEGTLEIMSPSSRHELIKKLVGRIIETYAFERDIDLRGHGSTTFQSEAHARGAEPDECYCLGRTIEDGALEAPDLAFEVALSSGVVNKLKIYQGLGVPEVWLFDRAGFSVYLLDGDAYRPVDRSALLPELDFAELTAYVEAHWKTQAIRPFVERLRAAKK